MVQRLHDERGVESFFPCLIAPGFAQAMCPDVFFDSHCFGGLLEYAISVLPGNRFVAFAGFEYITCWAVEAVLEFLQGLQGGLVQPYGAGFFSFTLFDVYGSCCYVLPCKREQIGYAQGDIDTDDEHSIIPQVTFFEVILYGADLFFVSDGLDCFHGYPPFSLLNVIIAYVL